jgi:hypothetical protein
MILPVHPDYHDEWIDMLMEDAFAALPCMPVIFSLPSGHAVQTANIGPTHFVLGDAVKIDLKTGAVTLLPGFTNYNDAAEKFWEAVQRMHP